MHSNENLLAFPQGQIATRSQHSWKLKNYLSQSGKHKFLQTMEKVPWFSVFPWFSLTFLKFFFFPLNFPNCTNPVITWKRTSSVTGLVCLPVQISVPFYMKLLHLRRGEELFEMNSSESSQPLKCFLKYTLLSNDCIRIQFCCITT